uniref:CRM domain-containing protein n=1 Tax=Nelumbo nucifera TaxID=4432 RepID=A0A822Z8L0_NELNU|nr:TPA_asm: hypothetical protein HUJ06_000924 [Nelumbo nucifera]
MEALKKIEPQESSEATHDPEILTPEEHFYFLEMGLKCKNFVPIGRRGIFQGVILNMHLHWKKHQTLKAIVKTFTPEEVKEIAAELARLSGGIVLDIHEENTIIMYRGKNYSQPPTEVMSPRITLSRKKALDKSKYRDGLRAVRKFIPRLQQDLELLQVKARMNHENGTNVVNESIGTVIDKNNHEPTSDWQPEDSEDDISEDDSMMESDKMSDSEALSDIFETNSDEQADEEAEHPLYLDEFDKFPIESNGELEDFEDHLRQISLNSTKDYSLGKDEGLPDLDEDSSLVDTPLEVNVKYHSDEGELLSDPSFVFILSFRKNYLAWEFQFCLYVTGKELWGHIDGTTPAPADATKLAKWKIKDARVMPWITGSCDSKIVLNLRPYRSAQTMWEYLKKVYNQTNSARRFQLECEIADYTQGSLSIQDYYSSFQNLWAEFSDIVCAAVSKVSLADVLVVYEISKRDQFLMKLRLDFENARSNLMNHHPPPTLDVCFSELLREEQRLLTQTTLE